MWVFPSLYTRMVPYGPYGKRRIHLRVLASKWPKYTRTPTGRPYSSDRKRVISYGLPTGYRRLSKPHIETEGLRHIAAYAEDRCMNYTKTYIYHLDQHTRTRFATNIKFKGENLPSHWSAVQPDSIKREILTIRFPFILTTLYIHVHVAILAAQFLFFFFLSFCNTRCRCASTKRYVHLKSGEDKTLSKIIFLVFSVWLFLERFWMC